ncbi:tyrosine-type recombinase/integrase [Glaciimonas sp. PAMC28666]|uniref:tyrosine-type recombinase/integrase n=1 Tax=Glaciimonas sp. PAMC28666 TaxID=2807626 RepID=UPI001963F8D3|nr:tyrosine-type recombinase/integrase [Glaciimonas sp. PAMC28666]QRX80815.1 tyrosine-type recombinase/integrase [Glaciimonas sp. PAMC28666]
MGRTPTRNKNLPAGMRARHRKTKIYYYLDTGARPRKEIGLGSDYVLAVKKWAELTVSNDHRSDLITFRYVAERYQREVLPQKAPRTQKNNLLELAWLYKFYDDPPAPLDSIEPLNIRQYLDWRHTSKVGANREKALFSHIWNFARQTGLTNKPNPCAGIKGFREAGRDVYISDAVYRAVWDAAEEPLRDALDLAYLTGQRPADVLKLSRNDIKDGALHIEQNKTGKKLRIAIEGDLETVIERAYGRKATSMIIINNKLGYPMNASTLRSLFTRAREIATDTHPELAKAIKEFQFRDLRAKAGTDKEEISGMSAAQDQLGHATATMTARYVRHRRGKLVKPTK